MADKVDFTKGIKIIISPTEKGFACGVINEKLDLSSEGMYLCHIIAHGMLRFSIDHPQDAFDLGMEQLQSKPHKNNGKDPRFLDYDNVIDLAEIMFKQKKDLN